MGWKAELRSCVKVEVDVLGSPSLIVCTVSRDVKHHGTGWKQASDLFDLFLHRTLFEGKGRKKKEKQKEKKRKEKKNRKEYSSPSLLRPPLKILQKWS